MSKNLLRIVTLMAVLALVAVSFGAQTAKAADKVVVTWFVGLGTGTDPAQIPVEKAVVEKFNASQDKIELKLNIAASNQVSGDALSTLIASGNSPDIVGPVGVEGSNKFASEWMDLKPLIEKTKYNIAQFPQNVVNIYLEGNGLYGIPFAVYPGVLYYNKQLFDDAGLAYPPKNFGDKYKLDGKDVDWTWDTVATIGKRLTIDANGNDATSDKFDPTKVVSFGFIHQWDTIRSDFETFGGAPVVDPASGKVKIADAWRAEAKWLWNGVWKDHFIPSNSYKTSDLFKPNEFASGKVAMARVMLWFTCCLGELKAKWDLAPVPMYNGKYNAPADADTFRVSKNTKHPDETFTVLQYLLGEGALDLLTAYGAYPARPDLQAQFIKKLAEKYPSVSNWDIVKPSFDYGTVPHHESAYPNFSKGQQRFTDFATLIYSDQGKSIDIDKELDKLQSDLQAIIDQK